MAIDFTHQVLYRILQAITWVENIMDLKGKAPWPREGYPYFIPPVYNSCQISLFIGEEKGYSYNIIITM